MRRVTFFFRGGGLIISQIDDSNTLASIGQRMCGGGFIIASDSFWGKSREIVINLADVKAVILEEHEKPQAGQG